MAVDEHTYTFRLPSFGQALTVQKQIAAAEEAQDFRGMEAAFGAWFLLVWDDEGLELEADPADGQAAFDELREHGWTLQIMGALFRHMSQLVQAEMVSESEVASRVDFFGAQDDSGALRLTSA